MHDYHENLPGYDPRQIWHDGCAECEERGERIGIASLDSSNFARAWRRAIDWNTVGANAVSHAEAPMLNALWAVQVQLERRGVPIGVLPGDDVCCLSGVCDFHTGAVPA